MKKIILAAIFVFCLIGCNVDDYVEKIGDKVGVETAYESSDGSVIVYFKYDDSEDLDKKYEMFGDLIEGFEDKIEKQILTETFIQHLEAYAIEDL